MRIFLTISCCIMIMFLTACRDSETNVAKPTSTPIATTPSPTTTPMASSKPIDPFLKEFNDIYTTQIKVGMTKNDVIKLFGNSSAVVDSVVGGTNKILRYDIQTVPNYHFEVCCDQVDEFGMGKKQIKAQFFVQLDKEEKVQSFYLHYIESNDGKNYTIYVKSSDRKEKQITSSGTFQ